MVFVITLSGSWTPYASDSGSVAISVARGGQSARQAGQTRADSARAVARGPHQWSTPRSPSAQRGCWRESKIWTSLRAQRCCKTESVTQRTLPQKASSVPGEVERLQRRAAAQVRSAGVQRVTEVGR